MNQTWQAYYDPNKLFLFYENLFSIKTGTAFDLIDRTFSVFDFSFLAKIAAFCSSLKTKELTPGEKNIPFLSSLAFLSFKIHYDMQNKLSKTECFRNNVQFPILIGDMIYGEMIERLVEKENIDMFSPYIAYLKKINAIAVDAADQKRAADQLMDMQYTDLAILTAELLLKEELDDQLPILLRQMIDCVLKKETQSDNNALQDTQMNRDLQSLLKTLKEDHEKQISSLTELKQYLR